MFAVPSRNRGFPNLFAFALVLGLLSVSLVRSEGSAADVRGDYVILGNTGSCGKHLEGNATDKGYDRVWLAGYLTAFNALTYGLKNVIKLTDIDGIEGEVVNYCRSHPATVFGDAVDEVVTSYYREHKEQLEQP